MKKTTIILAALLIALVLGACTANDPTNLNQREARGASEENTQEFRGGPEMRAQDERGDNEPKQHDSGPKGENRKPLPDINFAKSEELEEIFLSAYAEALGISVDELQESMLKGRRGLPLISVAEELGFEEEEAQALSEQAHLQALSIAVEEGLITQEQANQMAEEMNQMNQRNMIGRIEIAGATRNVLGMNPDECAEKLGISIEELHERLDGGETPAEIAESLGVELPLLDGCMPKFSDGPAERGRFGRARGR